MSDHQSCTYNEKQATLDLLGDFIWMPVDIYYLPIYMWILQIVFRKADRGNDVVSVLFLNG